MSSNMGLIIGLIIIGNIILGFIVSLIVVAILVFQGFFGRQEDDLLEKTNLKDFTYDICRDKIIEYRNRIKEFEYDELRIKSFDNLDLFGKMYKAEQNKDLIILFHGAHTIPENNFSFFIYSLYKKYNILLVRMRSHGESGGRNLTYGLKEKHDIISWLDFLGKKFDNIYLYGISMGAASIAFASDSLNRFDNVKGMIFDCGFNNISEVMSFIVSSHHLPGPLFVPGVKILHKLKFGVKMETEYAETHLRNNKIPCLFIEGERDDVVPPQILMKCYDACSSYKELIMVPDAGHAASVVVGGDEVINKIILFFERSKNNG